MTVLRVNRAVLFQAPKGQVSFCVAAHEVVPVERCRPSELEKLRQRGILYEGNPPDPNRGEQSLGFRVIDRSRTWDPEILKQITPEGLAAIAKREGLDTAGMNTPQDVVDALSADFQKPPSAPPKFDPTDDINKAAAVAAEAAAKAAGKK
jgi:hypothetical protein